MIYLACPYSHKEASIREQRFREICGIAGELMLRGEVVFCPIAHSHPIACQMDLPTEWGFWEKHDLHFLEMADKLVIAKMDGWETSYGVAKEIGHAQYLDIPVEYMEVA